MLKIVKMGVFYSVFNSTKYSDQVKPKNTTLSAGRKLIDN